jgi:hypothetical protein
MSLPSNFPAQLVSHISKYMSPNNRRRLALSSKKLPALNELRRNVKKEKREALKRHLTVMYKHSKKQGSTLLKKRTKMSRGVNKEEWGHVTRYYFFIFFGNKMISESIQLF